MLHFKCPLESTLFKDVKELTRVRRHLLDARTPYKDAIVSMQEYVNINLRSSFRDIMIEMNDFGFMRRSQPRSKTADTIFEGGGVLPSKARSALYMERIHLQVNKINRSQ